VSGRGEMSRKQERRGKILEVGTYDQAAFAPLLYDTRPANTQYGRSLRIITYWSAASGRNLKEFPTELTGRPSLPARVAHTLLQVARAFGKRIDHDMRFTISLTQQNLADLVGASRQHINYVLADFRSHRLITGSGRTLTLTDLEGLERIALAQ